MKNSDLSAIVVECANLIEAAVTSLSYREHRCMSEAERLSTRVLMNEYRAFADVKSILIDSDTGLFITEAGLRTVAEAIKRAGTEVFNVHFPLLQCKAFDLFIQLRDAGQQIVLSYDDSERNTIH